jgi:TPR repeat protein
MTVNDHLAAASADISSMPEPEITRRMDDLLAKHRARTGSDAARHAAEFDTADLDWAAYELARHYEDTGDLATAARWYRLCAASDLGDAALRLARVLDQSARQRATSPQVSPFASQRHELALVSDAARWYIEAYGAGHQEAAEDLDEMISRHDIRRPECNRNDPPAEQPAPRQGCSHGGLDTIMAANDLAGATAHFQQCTDCQREFLRRGGLFPYTDRRTPRNRSNEIRDTARPAARTQMRSGPATRPEPASI